MMVVDQT